MSEARQAITDEHGGAMSIETAMTVMLYFHAGQVDKRGEPYVLHPVAVLGLLDTWGLSPTQAREAQVVALLHDGAEDAPEKFEWIKGGLSKTQLAAVESVTRRDGESYMDYVRRAKRNPIGRRVKIADLMHNLSDERRTGDAREEERRSKYKAALAILRAREED